MKKISFVIPCLNEEITLPIVLEKINSLKINFQNLFSIEVVVSDNGSSDRSIEIAKLMNANVVHCVERGYGAALDFGIKNAKGEIIIFADADDTYDFLESPKLIEKILDGDFDLVIGSRLNGTIHPGAMPFLHRYLGTPVINFIINFLYGKRNKIHDANSGFRCFKKEKFLQWDVKSKGMEFASEMLIKSLMYDAKIAHVPISLYPDKPDRKPHLRTWRDGMRHLLRIFFHAPDFFNTLGSLLFMLGWLNLLVGFSLGRIIELGGIRIYGAHSLLLFSMLTIIGLSIWNIGLLISTKNRSQSYIIAKILDLEEDKLFFILLLGVFIIFTTLLYLIHNWKINNYQFLNFER